ncbi:hypothetical protein GXP67_13215 [Rhodocytophaga rosea]|uniref:Uncharacterized protein n=1 Tax=Rhodocytophaga rosea TaxID=2704465 RepID=A0A6C0GHN8_9BACT|nr:hypothetical protein [Rhodocytophaga rosea]QHT67518.1 hypothetical protein GXP67_13215 [Rhodocytophaga rosea]
MGIVKKLSFVSLLFISFNGKAQNLSEKEYIVLIVNIERKDPLHPGEIYYWIAASDTLNEEYEFNFSPLFLRLFYPSSSYDDCCEGRDARFYTLTDESKFEFTDEFNNKQENLRKFLKKNSKLIQVIKKKNGFSKLLNEKVTISATAIKTSLCSCKIIEEKHFESVFLPTTEFSLNNDFWNSDKAYHIKHKDYTGFSPYY